MKEYRQVETTKNLYSEETMFRVFVGTAEEIQSIYKSVEKNSRRHDSVFFSEFCDKAKFNPFKMYGIAFTQFDSSYYISYCILAGDTVLHMICDGVLQEVA